MRNAAHKSIQLYMILHTHGFDVCNDRLVSFGRCRIAIAICLGLHRSVRYVAYTLRSSSLYRRLRQYDLFSRSYRIPQNITQ